MIMPRTSMNTPDKHGQKNLGFFLQCNGETDSQLVLNYVLQLCVNSCVLFIVVYGEDAVGTLLFNYNVPLQCLHNKVSIISLSVQSNSARGHITVLSCHPLQWRMHSFTACASQAQSPMAAHSCR